jgi:PAS domain S-box-containing protein
VKSADAGGFSQAVLRCVADGVFTVDCDWRITSFNRAAERISGVSAERAIGMRCSDVFHADICGRRCAIRRTLETGCEVIDQPARILDRRGHSVPISISTAVLRDPDGALLGAVETFRDLSTEGAAARPADAVPPLRRSEADTIRSALHRHQGRLGVVAKALGVSRTTLWRKMRAYGLRAADFLPR